MTTLIPPDFPTYSGDLERQRQWDNFRMLQERLGTQTTGTYLEQMLALIKAMQTHEVNV